MRLFNQHRCAHRLRASGQHAALIFAATPFQINVQLVQVGCFRQRHQVVAPEVSAFAFDAALLVATCRVTELALKPPVRTERNEAARFLTATAAKDPLHSTLQVVVTEYAKNTIKISKGELMRFKKCLLGG